MPSSNMLPKGQRRHTVKPQYRATRGIEPPAAPEIPVLDLDLAPAGELRHIPVPEEARGLRLDQYLAQAIPEISRSRVQLLIEHGQVAIGGNLAKPRHKLTPGEIISIEGNPRPEPLRATPRDVPLDLVYEDSHLAVVNKPAGMTVHAGAGTAEPIEGSEEPAATLVDALLHHFGGRLSSTGGELRPGIVHRLDKQTSGLIVIAKDDPTHRRLSEMFAEREVEKTYLALVHGHLRQDQTTVKLPIGRDNERRTRMTTRRPADAPGVRPAVSHLTVLERLETPWGPFTLVEVGIETGRTHQIRVHLQALGHPVVGDTVYGAPEILRNRSDPAAEGIALGRNFLHAARLRLPHPGGKAPALELEAPLPAQLADLLDRLRTEGVRAQPAVPRVR